MPYPCENGCNWCDDCTDWEDNDTTSAAQSLAPCPFCGAPASGYAIEAHEHSSPLKALGIPDHAGSYVIEGDCQCGSGLIGETQEEVTARWNRRSQPTPPAVVEPLTDEMVADLWRKWVGTVRPNFSFARDIERAHGIGAKP